MANLEIQAPTKAGYTVAETAALLSCSEGAVHRAIDAGFLSTITALAPRVIIPAASIDFLIDRSMADA